MRPATLILLTMSASAIVACAQNPPPVVTPADPSAHWNDVVDRVAKILEPARTSGN